jgi:phospholipase/carboxylesterase
MSSGLSRREALSVALGGALFACRSEQHAPAPSPVASAAPLPTDFGGLEVTHVTSMQGAERGGHAVVLLHGYGARGDDLAPLARALLRPRTRFVLPAAPLAMGNGGRAWWAIDAADRPPYVTDSGASSNASSSPALDAARSAVQRVLARTIELFAPDTLSIAGFSQGAMLSLDVALVAPPAVARIGLLSGALLVDAAERLQRFGDARPAVFVAHGREDRRLPFSGAERTKAALEERGFSVTWRPFSGGHEIPDNVVRELGAFLFGA